MYIEGIGAAIVLGVMALLAPGLWLTWWLLADLGEGVSGSDHTRPRAA
jgi:hypothetical protein